MTGFVGRLWSRLWLRGLQLAGNYRQLERLYMVEDPWNLASEHERQRFAQTNARIAQFVPDCASLLEIGSGEGAQTGWLTRIGPSVTGIEVSERAVTRARAALPDVRFMVGRGEDVGALLAGERFDCVLACEVLYYAAEPEAVIAAMQGLSDRILVTVYSGRFDQLAQLFTAPGWTRQNPIEAEGHLWQCYVWERAGSDAGA